jgi:alpha-beta hydrolase superfamily lysophospholipase
MTVSTRIDEISVDSYEGPAGGIGSGSRPLSATPPARPLYLDVAAEGLFAVFHDASASSAKSAVLLCPPFGWDDMCSYRSRRAWAEHLAVSGHPALRIDLPGSGDSAGDPSDPARVKAWVEAVSASSRWLKERTSASRIVAIGIGMGGLLAYLAAADRAPIDDLVLWAVPARGRSMIRELRAFERLGASTVFQPDETQPPPLPDGALAANGYLLSAETVASLEAVDLAELSLTDGEHRRVLLLSRDGREVDERLHSALQQAGAQASVASGAGYDKMMLEPQDSRPPVEVFETVSAWLLDADGSATGEARKRASHKPPVSEAQELILEATHSHIRESLVHIAQPDGRLLGILCQPQGPPRDLCALLLNAGPQRRTGPNRMWVEIARRWAARGVPTLRIDLAGIGDSDGDAGRLAQVTWPYVPEYIAQVRAALDALEADGLPGRFIAMGLCSGAYWSFHAALEDDRIRAICLLNPRTLIWDEWTHARRRTHDLRERLFRASTWRKILRGEITLHRHLQTAKGIANHALRTPTRLRTRLLTTGAQQASEDDALDGLLDRLRDRDQRALLLFTGSEPLHADFDAEGRLARLERWTNLRLAIHGISADTHTMAPLWLQAEVHELLDLALEEELQRL